MLTAGKNKKGKDHFNRCVKNTKIVGDLTVYMQVYICMYMCVYAYVNVRMYKSQYEEAAF